MSDKDHPIWPIIRMLITFLAVLTTLKITATNFDATEVISLIGLVLAQGSVEAAVRKIAK